MFEERTNYSEGEWYDVVFTGVGMAPDGTTRPISPGTIPFYKHPVRLLFERYTPNSGGDRREWKDFEHYKCAIPPLAVSGTVKQITDSYVATISALPPQVYTVGIHPNAYAGADPNLVTGTPVGPELLSPTADGHFVPLPAGLSGMESAAFSRFIPEMRSNLSLVNSLIELKDIVTLRQSVERAALTLLTLKALIRQKKLSRVTGSWTFRELAQRYGDAFLQWKFNFRPLIADIRGIYASLSQLDRRMNDLISRANRPLIAYYKYEWVEFENGSYDEIYPGPHGPVQFPGQPWWYGQIRLHSDVAFKPTKFHATMSYSYHYPAYTLENARVKGLLDALGVQLNPAIIWNAIPYTFIGDWFVGVSRFLDSLKVRNLEPVLNIRDYCVSVKREKEITRTNYVCQNEIISSDGGQAVSLPVIRETAYRRFIKMPTRSSLVASGLNSSEFALGVALVVSRRNRPRRQRNR